MGRILSLSSNNSYQAARKMAPFWSDLNKTLILGSKMIQEMVKKIKGVQGKMKAIQDMQNSYAN